jgi:tetratricopeptide (TPR) repeat protein
MNRMRLLSVVAALVLAPLLFLGAGVLVREAPAQEPAPASAGPPDIAAVASGENAAVANSGDIAAIVTGLQDRLRRLPEDWQAWAALGSAYVEQARLSADPSAYPKAEDAFARSLEMQPELNADALTGQATLAAARHDFAEARELALQAAEINPYSATTQGVLADALIELGDYDEAFDALQRMVDLRPGVPSFARVAYSYELRGDDEGATYALEQALAVASTPADAAYALHQLGELAFNNGNLEEAAARFAEGLARDPSYLPLLAGQAKVKAAQGDVEGALADYATVVQRLPQPNYVIEYADLLASLGREEEAQAQYAVADAAQRLFAAEGVRVDLELSLYDADHGRPVEALEAAEAEWERRSTVHVEDAYAWALHVNGRSEEALEHAYAAQELGTRSALFAFHRGMIEKELGMDEKARASLTEALDINPYFSVLHAPTARAALDELASASDASDAGDDG